MKLHRQLGHASFSSLPRLIKLAKRTCPGQRIIDASKRCSRRRIDASTQRPFENKYFPAAVVGVIFADVFYHVQKSHSYPAAVFCDSVTLFCAGSLLKDVSHSTLESSFLQNWIRWLGPPKKLIVDSGSHCVGKQWSVLSNTFGFAVVVVPVKSHHSAGKAEWLIQTLLHA